MAEVITTFTVPEKFACHSSVRDTTPLQKVVGILNDKGREIWVPDNPKFYYYNGGYSMGFSKQDVAEIPITLPTRFKDNFMNFFENYLVKREWCDVGLLSERYDCHWYAFMLKGILREGQDTDDSLDFAEAVIKSGRMVTELQANELGVIGQNTGSTPVADHSMIGLNEGQGLQVMGMHDAVTIAPQQATVQHYREMAEYYDVGEAYGLHAVGGC